MDRAGPGRDRGGGRQAESLTSGEIVVVIDRAARSYRTVPMVMALALALFVPWPLLALTVTSAPRIFLIQLICAARAAGSPALVWPRRTLRAGLRQAPARP